MYFDASHSASTANVTNKSRLRFIKKAESPLKLPRIRFKLNVTT